MRSGKKPEEFVPQFCISKRGYNRHSKKSEKQINSRRERRAAKCDPECQPRYRIYSGYSI